MAVKLNEPAYDSARELVRAGKYVIDGRDDWSEHQPSTQQQNEFIEQRGIGEYARWHLGPGSVEQGGVRSAR
jgi:hypothetical protein